MRKQKEFFNKYKIDRAKFDECNLDWNTLNKISDDYEKLRPELDPMAKYITDCLRQVDAVHSLKFRLKDSDHLIEKIIRKQIKSPDTKITVDNYRTTVTDLIGIRALHLFKEDWMQIHDFITRTWTLHENPIANVRKGDSDSFIKVFSDKHCEIKEHIFGYRSVHYLIKFQPTKDIQIAEIQVRTIFEEGWSEIDHRIRYPYDLDNSILNEYLFIFNRLAGSADEMGSFVGTLKQKLVENEKLVSELKEQINELGIEKKEMEKLQSKLDSLSRSNSLILGENSIFSGSISAGEPLRYLIGSPIVTERKCSVCGKTIKDSVTLASSIIRSPICTECQSSTFRVGT